MKNNFLLKTFLISSVLLILANIIYYFMPEIKVKELNYVTALYKNNNLEIEYPDFDNPRINNKINEIINSFDLKEGFITYKANIINNKYLSVIFSLPDFNYKSYFINLDSMQELTLSDIINNEKKFIEKIVEALDSKYPKFIFDAIQSEVNEMSYLIKANEMVVYFSNDNIIPKVNDKIFIVLNYNEIYSYLKIPYTLDLEYVNQNIYKLDPNKRAIAITFDDGPASTTNEIIKILKENKATATFFMLGEKMSSHSLLMRQVLIYGNEIGSHSYSHKYLNRIKTEDMLNEINKPNAIYKDLMGEEIKLFRVPYGSINKEVKENINMPIIKWNIDSLDWKYKDAEVIKDHVLEDIKDGSIILMHDTHKRTVEAVKLLLPEIYARGYQVVSVSKLAELKNKSLENNTIYTHISDYNQ